MRDCFTTWQDALALCTNEVGFDDLPEEITVENANIRAKVCAAIKCRDLTIVFLQLIADKCEAAIEEQARTPNGIWSSSYCPRTLVPPMTRGPETTAPAPTQTTANATKTPSPTTVPPTPNTTTVAPVSQGPEPAPTSSVPMTEIVTSPPETTVSPVASATPVPRSEDSVRADAKSSGMSVGAIVGGGGGGLAVLILIILAIVFVRRKRRGQSGDGKQVDDHYVRDFDTATTRTEPTTTNGSMWGGLSISMHRIPFEKIKVGEMISQGGFGEVFRGTYNGQAVAVKRLLAMRRKDKENLNSFLDEIKLTASLEHECIVRFIGVAWDAPADLCMISELMLGGDLRSLLTEKAKQGAPNGYDDEKLRIAVQVAHALTYLHSLQPVVVHRDLKSRNILLTEDRNAKLIDFGVSTEQRDLTMTAGVGTSLWMAPEIMMGERYDEKADVFSFGVVLSELDTHELPYSHARDTTSSSGRKMPDLVVMQQVAQGRMSPQFSESADPDIVALARECLVVQPKLRPTAANVLYRIHKTRQRASVA